MGILGDYSAGQIYDESGRIPLGQHSIVFALEETATLLNRFTALDRKLQADEEHFSPGYQSGPMRYFFNEMPADFTLADFIASWS